MGRPQETNEKTVIRFIATPVNPDPMLPYGSFVIGHGWRTTSGRQHRDLAKLYSIDQEADGLYAGYLYLEGQKVRLFSGGSSSLGISDNTETDKVIDEMLTQDCGAFARILGHLFPLVTSGAVPHARVAVFW